jgi:hypothetical protein
MSLQPVSIACQLAIDDGRFCFILHDWIGDFVWALARVVGVALAVATTGQARA